MKKSKRYLDIKNKIEDKEYSLNDSLNLIKDISSAKFDESVEIHLLTNADPKNADQQLRTVADLPHGTGKQVRVLVFAEGDAAVSAKEAGADFISDEEIVKNIEKGWQDFDVAIATPDQMSKIGKQKMQDLNAMDEEAAAMIIAGTARSMGIEVEGV